MHRAEGFGRLCRYKERLIVCIEQFWVNPSRQFAHQLRLAFRETGARVPFSLMGLLANLSIRVPSQRINVPITWAEQRKREFDIGIIICLHRDGPLCGIPDVTNHAF